MKPIKLIIIINMISSYRGAQLNLPDINRGSTSVAVPLAMRHIKNARICRQSPILYKESSAIKLAQHMTTMG